MRLAGTSDDEGVRKALRAAIALPIRLYADDDLHLHALTIAQRHRLPATYDAHYLALAERLGIDFYTGDQRLWNSVRHQLPWVRLVESQT
jgi:predicted nucleic acid-binding protein